MQQSDWEKLKKGMGGTSNVVEALLRHALPQREEVDGVVHQEKVDYPAIIAGVLKIRLGVPD